jgi:3-oxoacyl-(acyl-carrier-protein) synthase
MSVEPAIVVTGLGALSPLGLDVESFWSAALAGVVGTGELARFDTESLSSRRGGEARRSPQMADTARCAGASLTVDLAVAASTMAVEDSTLRASGVDPERVGVCFGTVMATRPSVERWLAGSSSREPGPQDAGQMWISPSSVSRAPAKRLGFGGPNCVISTACAAGNSAIAYAANALSAGRADAMVAGGADELSQAMLMMFDSFRALAPDVVRPFDLHRRGLLLAEGAAALVLEREIDARARGARMYGRVLGWANAADAHHMTAPHPDGDGAIRSMLGALERAGAAPADLDYISAHGTGTPSNDAVEAHAIRRMLGADADDIPVSALKGSLGHSQGAASAIEAVACLLAIRDGLVPPTANHCTRDPACDIDVVAGRPREARLRLVLNNAFGFGGNIECVVLGAV